MVSIKEGWRMVEASATARAKHDHRRAGKTQCRAEQITCLRPHAIDAPQPQQRDGEVHAAICGLDAAGGGRMQCQQPEESRQADRKSGGDGKSVAVRGYTGGPASNKKKNKK